MSGNEPQTNPSLWQLTQGDGFTTLKFAGALWNDSAKLFEQEYPKLVKAEPVQHFVLHFSQVSDISPAWMRALLAFRNELKAINKLVRLILVNSRVKTLIKEQGLESALTSVPTLREALLDFGLVTKKALDVNFVNPFLAATMRVLKVQMQVDAKPGKLSLLEGSQKFQGDISGVLGLVSEAFNGSIVISFPEATFLKIMSKMLGEEFKSLTKEIEDGAGELTNMIFGQAKTLLNERGYALQTAIPAVVTGANHSVQGLSKGPRVTVPFETEIGPFYIEICISG